MSYDGGRAAVNGGCLTTGRVQAVGRRSRAIALVHGSLRREGACRSRVCRHNSRKWPAPSAELGGEAAVRLAVGSVGGRCAATWQPPVGSRRGTAGPRVAAHARGWVGA
jgi:hypothetical protein